MYLSTYYALPSTSSSSIFRDCTVRVASTAAHSLTPPSRTFSRCPPPSTASYQSLRWSRGADWQSPVSLRAHIRTVSPVLHRKITTMGMIRCVVLWYVVYYWFLLSPFWLFLRVLDIWQLPEFKIYISVGSYLMSIRWAPDGFWSTAWLLICELCHCCSNADLTSFWLIHLKTCDC